MMKKLMFALLAAVCSSLMAEVLVYDYAASFKRLDVTAPVKVKFEGTTYKMDTAKVASDKFTGYVVVDACEECYGGMKYSAELGETVPGNYAVVYIKRSGNNKYTKNAVYRAIGRFYAAKFGAKSGIAHKTEGDTGYHVNPTKYTDALGFLSYWIDADGVPAVGKTGFMGVDQSGKVSALGTNWWEKITAHDPLLAVDYDTVDNAGYGKLIALKQILTSSCFADTTSVCWAVKNLSGSILGGFTYTGTCNNPLYDLCYIDATSHLPAEAYTAPIAGTFTMKLNNALSFYKKEFRQASFTSAEGDIMAKLKVSEVFGNEKEWSTFNADKGEALKKPLAW
ncbi:MAG: hypothetical protein IKO65_02105 [Victivallales bacterium]|nr:hypothetical protein [Victivallales bacterium]